MSFLTTFSLLDLLAYCVTFSSESGNNSIGLQQYFTKQVPFHMSGYIYFDRIINLIMNHFGHSLHMF